MAIFFTADTHFCHKRSIVFCNRPYADVPTMHEALVLNWNTRVKADDTIYVLGDFAYQNKPGVIGPLFHRLNGRKHLIIGNHDDQEVLSLPWSSPPSLMQEVMVMGAGKDRRVVLCHYPMRSWPHMYRGAVHLYGHEHGNIPDYHNACDVGVDRWQWRPVTLDEAMQRMMTQTRNPVGPMLVDGIGHAADAAA